METLMPLLFLVSLICLLLGLAKPGIFSKLFKGKATRKKVLLVFGVLTVVFMFLTPTKSSTPENSSQTNSNTEQSKSEIEYEKFFYENNKLVENYWLIVKAEGKNQEQLEAFARDFKKKNCKKDCNISLFDDKKAAELDREYAQITDMTKVDEWKKKNYVYVADHLVGYLMFGDDEYYNDYPYKDWYYKELTGTSSN